MVTSNRSRRTEPMRVPTEIKEEADALAESPLTDFENRPEVLKEYWERATE